MATAFQYLQFFDENGDPLAGGKVYWYEAGTSTPKDTWIDQAESSAAANPVVLDSDGYPDHGSGPNFMWIRGSYKIIIKDSDGTTLFTDDNVNEYDQIDFTGLTATIADLNSTTTTTLAKTSDYTVQITDRGKTILADASSGAVIITLPSVATAGNKFKIIIKKIDNTTNAVTVTGSGTETIDRRDDYVLLDYFDFIEPHCNGSTWYVVALGIRGSIRVLSTATALELGDNTKLIAADASGGSFAVTLPSAVTVGRGWEIGVKKTDASTNIVTISAPGGQTIDGAVSQGIFGQYGSINIRSDGANYLIVADSGDGITSNPFPFRYLAGFRYGQNVANPTTHIDIWDGSARGRNDLNNMVLGNTGIAKDLSNSWAEGTGNGGRPTAVALAADTWFFVFVISKNNGTVDAGFDDNLNATNLLADASDYTDFIRIGFIKTEAGSTNIRDFYMFTGETGRMRRHIWKDIVPDYNAALTAGSGTIVLNSCPPFLNVDVVTSAVCIDNTHGHAFFTFGVKHPSATGYIHLLTGVSDGGGGTDGSGSCIITSDTSKQIDYTLSGTIDSLTLSVHEIIE